MRRSDFPILKKKIKGRPMIYFDHAATAHKPRPVLRALNSFYRRYNANVHRGLDPLSEQATRLYEEARRSVARFISAQAEEIIFTRNATEGINLVARTWGESRLKRGDMILLSQAEHHANLVPWLQLKNKLGLKLSFIPIKQSGHLDMAAAKKLLRQKHLKLLSLSQASNVLGLMNDLPDLLAQARARKITTLVDACQSAAHEKINVQDLGADFLVFSGHKLGGPTGIGVLYGRRDVLASLPPYLGGGAMVAAVNFDAFQSVASPHKFEAGTPAIAEAIALAAACRYLDAGWPERQKKERALTTHFLRQAAKYDFIKIWGEGAGKLPIFSLSVSDVHPHDLAYLLGQKGIIVRAGHHCAQPLHDCLGLSATLRVSLNFYNTKAEINTFFRQLNKIYQFLHPRN